MRVLFVSGLTSYGMGGAQLETIRLIQGIAAQCSDVGIVVDGPLQALPNVRHFTLTYPPTPDAASQVRDAMSSFTPDVVHLVGGGVGLLRQLNAVVPPVPWVFTAHNVPPAERSFPGLYGHNDLYYLVRDLRALPSTLIWKSFLRNASFRYVIAHSEAVAQRLRDYGTPRTKVLKIPFGFGVPALTSEGRSPFAQGASPKILTIGGFAHHKGLHDIVRIMGRIRSAFPRAHCCILGERRYRGYAAFLQNLIKEERVADCVSLIFDADEETKVAALNNAELYIQASHEEGFCLAFAEAAAFIPRLVGTDTGEIRGLAADDACAVVVAPKDLNGLLDAATSLLGASPPADAQLQRRARLRERYSWLDYYARHVAAYTGQQA
jgi:glycosyltransferase involved in cell wall biosynthesis